MFYDDQAQPVSTISANIASAFDRSPYVDVLQ